MIEIPKGYYLKARVIQHSAISTAPPHIREIWDYLLREANHSDNKYSGFEVKRGQLFRTYKDIREALHWQVGYRKMMYSENHTKKAMKFLREHLMIATTKELGGVLITVLNYAKYQDPKNYERTNESTYERTIAEPMRNQPLPDNNKNERIKELNKLERHIDFLLNIPDEVIKDFSKEFNVYEQGIRGKGTDLYNYCKAKGKLYKDYKAFLRNAVKKDFGLRPIEPPKPWEIHHEVDRGGLQKLSEMKKGLNFSFNKK